MSLRIRRILVAIGDPWQVPAGQLLKAAQIARAAKAQLELCHAVHPDRVHAIEPLRERMERLAARKNLEGIDVRSSLAIDFPPHEAIVRRAEATRASLIVAATVSHSVGKRLLLRNTDWELIRHAPCPLLLVKAPGRYRQPAVLASIDPFHARAKPQQLDTRLLAAAQDMAALLRGRAHAFHAYLPLVTTMPGALGQPMSLGMPPDAEAVHSANVKQAFERLAASAGIAAARRHLRMGDVPTQLLGVVARTRASIVVMGAVSRSALKRLFVGSTAEHILDRLACDALIIKPRK